MILKETEVIPKKLGNHDKYQQSCTVQQKKGSEMETLELC